MAKRKYIYSKDKGSFLEVTEENKSVIQKKYQENPEAFELIEADNQEDLESYHSSKKKNRFFREFWRWFWRERIF